MFILVSIFHKLGLNILTYFRHGQYSWSGNNIILVCKLHVWDLWVIPFIWHMSESFKNVDILVFLEKSESIHLQLNIFYYSFIAIALETISFDNLLKFYYTCVFVLCKNSAVDSRDTVRTFIKAHFLMSYRLV